VPISSNGVRVLEAGESGAVALGVGRHVQVERALPRPRFRRNPALSGKCCLCQLYANTGRLGGHRNCSKSLDATPVFVEAHFSARCRALIWLSHQPVTVFYDRGLLLRSARQT
jgi:hypothetical protein